MSGIKYIKPFDGLRGIGALFILSYHWPGKIINISHGWEFMQLFFVMSGYLITKVLLEEKEKFDFKKYALRFYYKRSIRLFPLYFIYLFLGIALYLVIPAHLKEIKYMTSEVYTYAGYLFTYTYNFMSFAHFLQDKSYVSGFLTTHLWTLSLEEQFYLLFPFLVFFLSLKNLKRCILLAIVLAPVFRVLFYFWAKQHNPDDQFWIAQNMVRLPWNQMDSLAFGALLAVYPFENIKRPLRLYIYFTVMIIAIYAINILYTRYVQGIEDYTLTFGKKLAENWIIHNYLFVYLITLVNAWCMLTLLTIIKGYRWSAVLENKWLVYIGRRSYAVYLFHLPILFVYLILINTLLPMRNKWFSYLFEIPLFICFILIVLLIANFFGKYVEAYFMKFKNRLS